MDIINKINSTENITQLENIGSTLTLRQIEELLNNYPQINPKEHWKLSHILSHIPHELFISLLLKASAEQIEVLKQEPMADALQRNFTMLSNMTHLQMNELFSDINRLEKEIAALQPGELGVSDLLPIEEEIDKLTEEHQELIEIIDKGLSLAWNTNRADTIETLSTTKERLQKSLNSAIGHSHENNSTPTGLYQLLENKLFSVYGDPSNPLDIEALDNNSPILEALTRLGISTVQDYHALGILDTPEEGKQNPQQVLNDVKQHLSELGLNSLKDLKDAYIFSKKSLAEYLSFE